jgi:hypothetical protein
MFFISKRNFEKKVNECVEAELEEFHKARHLEERARADRKLMGFLADRIAAVEEKCGMEHPYANEVHDLSFYV